jgi:queuine tRNA-ribosyltransferase
MNNQKFSFKIKATKGQARAGTLLTPHGQVETPIFMPVGTRASVKSLGIDDLKAAGSQIILGGNTYHMYFRPGLATIQKAGGMHRFMQWNGPMLTDSGGYQVTSLSQDRLKTGRQLSQVTDKGVNFLSPYDGRRCFFSAKKSLTIQSLLGADIIMAFDEATPNKGKIYAKKAMDRTHRWLLESIRTWDLAKRQSITTGFYQALFGIIQGGDYQDLRRKSAQFIVDQNLPGIAIGGQTVGQDLTKTKRLKAWIDDLLPKTKPLYMMGLGKDPQDVVEAVMMGVDIFDCVVPTRMARNGSVYQGNLGFQKDKIYFHSQFAKGRLNIGNKRFSQDLSVIQPGCRCPTCRQGYTRAYLHHLFRTKELLYYRLASVHNITYILDQCRQMRDWIQS